LAFAQAWCSIVGIEAFSGGGKYYGRAEKISRTFVFLKYFPVKIYRTIKLTSRRTKPAHLQLFGIGLDAAGFQE
jgi:hypothetical protein